MATSSPSSQVGSSPPDVSNRWGVPPARLGELHVQVALAAELGDRRFRVVERLAVLAGEILDRLYAAALQCARHDRGRAALGRLRLGVGGLDRVDVVSVDHDRVPAERADPLGVALGVPAQHRLARLAEPVDVDDRDQVVEAFPAGVLERLPHRALGHLGVAAQAPHAVRQAVQPAARDRHADRDRQPLAERAGGDIGRRDARRRVALEPRAELPERQQLLVVDDGGRLQHRVVERRGVALGEDQVVGGGVVEVRRVEPQVAVDQHRQQIGGGHRRGRVAGAGGSAGADRVHPQLLPQLPPEVGPLAHHAATSWSRFASRSANKSRNDLANFSTPSRSSVSTTSS